MIIKNTEFLEKKPKKYPGLWISVSKVKTFKQCPAKYRFSYIEHLPKQTKDYFIFGNFLHEILELFHQEIIDGNEEKENKLMTKCFSDVSKRKEFQKHLTSAQKDESFQILIKYLQLLEKQRKAETSPNIINVEEKFYIDINNGEFLLNGLIDRVQIDPDGKLHVADYKTTNAKSLKYLKKDHFQLLFYALVMSLGDSSLDSIRTSYILLRNDFEMVTRTYNRKKIETFSKKLLEQAQIIRDEKLWRPKPTLLCKWCDFCDKEICDEGFCEVNKTKSLEYGECGW